VSFDLCRCRRPHLSADAGAVEGNIRADRRRIITVDSGNDAVDHIAVGLISARNPLIGRTETLKTVSQSDPRAHQLLGSPVREPLGALRAVVGLSWRHAAVFVFDKVLQFQETAEPAGTPADFVGLGGDLLEQVCGPEVIWVSGSHTDKSDRDRIASANPCVNR
jgi:hypothetical protein